MAISKGVYSLYNGWLKKPEKQDIPETPNISDEYNEWVNKANACNTIEEIDNFLDDLYKLRQNGLLTDGEFGVGNLVFKELRNNNVLQDLKDKKVELENKEMSLGEQLKEDLMDMGVYKELTPEQQKYVDDWDLFLKQKDGKLVVSDWNEEWEYDTIEELKADLDYSIEETKKLGLDEAVIEEASEEDVKAQALAKYFDESVEAIEEDDGYYTLPMGETYLVLTEDEAYQAAKREIREVFEDLGLEAFTKDFQDNILNFCVDEDVIQDFINEEIYYYRNQEEDEEMADYLETLSPGDALYYVRDMFGDDKSFSNWLFDNNGFDMEEIEDEAINLDGVAHFIATYDGDELELDNNLFAYRVV